MGWFLDRRLPPAAYERVRAFLDFAAPGAEPMPVTLTAGRLQSVLLHSDGVMRPDRLGNVPPHPFFGRFESPGELSRDAIARAIHMTLPSDSAVKVEWGAYDPPYFRTRPGTVEPEPRYVCLWGDGHRALRPISTWTITIAWRTEFSRLGPELLRWTARAEAAIDGRFKRSRWRWWEVQRDGSVRLRLIKREEWLAAMTPGYSEGSN